MRESSADGVGSPGEHPCATLPETALGQPGRKQGVLVVDDEPAVRKLLQLSLERQGFAVWLAADGRQALELYERHRDRVDVVLLDVRMPGLDGPQTLAALRRLNPQVPCCFMTGDAGHYDTAELRARGAIRVFLKPFRPDEVGNVLACLASNCAAGRA
jgi:CheY-like chemotaxis protein